MGDHEDNKNPKPQTEQSFETGMDEKYKHISGDLADNWSTNRKNTFDNLTRNQQTHQQLFEDGTRQARQELAAVNSIVTQHLQNAVQNIALVNANAAQAVNLAQLQAVAHRDIAIDNEWNPVQQGTGDNLTARPVVMDDAALKAIGATVAQALAGVGPAITAAIAQALAAAQPK